MYAEFNMFFLNDVFLLEEINVRVNKPFGNISASMIA